MARAAMKAEPAVMVGVSPAVTGLRLRIAAVVGSGEPVLVVGDSGVGKADIARLIHDRGPRADGPFTHFPCAAHPESVVQSELFGPMRDDNRSRSRLECVGAVATAEHGTLYLDLVEELPFGAQAEVLRLIVSREYLTLGGCDVRRADVRLVAGAIRDLGAAVEARTFRADLHHRLSGTTITVPTLAERVEDIPALAEALVVDATRYGAAPLPFSSEAIAALQAGCWPGNVRQLFLTILFALDKAQRDGARQVSPEHLFPRSTREIPEATSRPGRRGRWLGAIRRVLAGM